MNLNACHNSLFLKISGTNVNRLDLCIKSIYGFVEFGPPKAE